MEFIHPAQRRRRIGTPSRKSRSHGDALCDVDMDTAAHMALVHDESCRTIGEITFIRLEARQVHTERDSLLLPRQCERICECKRLHDGCNLMIPVIPKSQNVERQIDLCPSESRHHRKSFLHCLEKCMPLRMHPSFLLFPD